MVFPSIPIYVDTPNWNQQQQPHGPGTNTSNYAGSGYDTIQLLPMALTPNPVPNLSAPDPTSLTADRVRPTRLPHPESGLNCPRCNSTNTKFCYFNNYSLSQPRHFCRACRRYWTRGGTLRNIPVGGGTRRNRKLHKPTPSIATSAQSGKHQHSNSNIRHFGTSSSSATGLGESNIGLRYSGMQTQFQQIPFAGAFELTHVLPIQLGASNHVGPSSRNEELLSVRINSDGTGMERGGSQAYFPSFNSSSLRNAIQPHPHGCSINYNECFMK